MEDGCLQRLIMLFTVALITLCIGLPIPAQDTKTDESSDFSIVVAVSQPNPKPPSFVRRDFKLNKRGPTLIDLGLVEDIDDQEVTLNFRDNAEYRMFQRYRTSMSISVEGPHVDLMDWRHFDSPWTPLKNRGPKRFRTLASDQMDATRFPATTKAEIVKEVRRRVGEEWPEALELAKNCNGPNDGACIVMISSIYLRIQKKVRKQWVNVGLVEIRIPMGC